MKTKEFIKRVEELGFGVKVYDSQIRILANDFIISVVYIGREYMINTYKPVSLAFRNEDELFDLIIKYAKTPVDEREEEKKFYLKHRWMRTINGFSRALKIDIDCGIADVGYICPSLGYKNQFTKKEIEEIKEKFNTDLADFEEIEVKE
ncbi:hypothetical protein [Anaerococcus vaginalis]|uniref:hypothetical protein n=1 Tax=Anaerococcus vaginalis TaxID=33037 RepID=UPI0029010634|nr:hypothetical protein [Anaerococcus vaginalis]MDU2648337.1 hypothetical protein [Anaerococcus vaginalis]